MEVLLYLLDLDLMDKPNYNGVECSSLLLSVRKLASLATLAVAFRGQVGQVHIMQSLLDSQGMSRLVLVIET